MPVCGSRLRQGLLVDHIARVDARLASALPAMSALRDSRRRRALSDASAAAASAAAAAARDPSRPPGRGGCGRHRSGETATWGRGRVVLELELELPPPHGFRARKATGRRLRSGHARWVYDLSSGQVRSYALGV